MAQIERKDAELNSSQRRDARRRESPNAAVVYEAIRLEAAAELKRPLVALGWSALAAGLSMGFSLVAEALLYAYTPQSTWRPVVSSFGYSVGFLFVILGRQQLFTENTLMPVLELLRAKTTPTLVRTFYLWIVILTGNLAGTGIFAFTLANFDVLGADIDGVLAIISEKEYGTPTGTMFLRAIFAGWLVALMLWLMPFAETARVGVIIVVSYVIGLAHFPHIIAGSVTALYSVFSGAHDFAEFFAQFFVPTLFGNIVGGVMLVAAINYAQVALSDRNGD